MILILLLSAIVAIAQAHLVATGIVTERMENMKAIGVSTRAIGQMTGDQETHDAALVATEADKMAELIGNSVPKLFPEGSTVRPTKGAADLAGAVSPCR